MKIKHIVVSIVLTVLTVGISKAQKSGELFIGGSLSINNSNSEDVDSDDKKTSVYISPIFGKMINDKIALGINVQYNYSKSEYNEHSFDWNSSYKSEVLSFIPFVRIHSRIAEKLKFYSQPFIGASFLLNDESEHRTEFYNAGITFGFIYAFLPQWSLETSFAGLEYKYQSDKDYDVKANQFYLHNNLANFNIGVRHYF